MLSATNWSYSAQQAVPGANTAAACAAVARWPVMCLASRMAHSIWALLFFTGASLRTVSKSPLRAAASSQSPRRRSAR
ncbi:hypothetical protein D3C78_1809720 [compost metagenome]